MTPNRKEMMAEAQRAAEDEDNKLEASDLSIGVKDDTIDPQGRPLDYEDDEDD